MKKEFIVGSLGELRTEFLTVNARAIGLHVHVYNTDIRQDEKEDRTEVIK